MNTVYVIAVMTSLGCGSDVLCYRAVEPDSIGQHARTYSTLDCRAQKTDMLLGNPINVAHRRVQVSPRSFGILAEAETSPHRMELSVQASGAVATEWCGQIRSIPFKKAGKAVVPYLEKAEMDALLAAPDRRTAQGWRDYALLLFLYNSGARATEAAQLKGRDLDIRGACVKITGKGGKQRLCPLWPATMVALEAVMAGRTAVFPALNPHACLPSSPQVKLCRVTGGSRARLDPIFPMKSLGASELRYVVREAT